MMNSRISLAVLYDEFNDSTDKQRRLEIYQQFQGIWVFLTSMIDDLQDTLPEVQQIKLRNLQNQTLWDIQEMRDQIGIEPKI